MLLTHDERRVFREVMDGTREAFATTMVGVLIRLFGVQALNWDGVTIELELKDELGIEMPRVRYDQMMCLVTAMTTDEAYISVPFFDEFVSGINGRGVGIEDEPPTVRELAWAVAELDLNDPEPVGRLSIPYSPNVQRYMQVILDDEGMTVRPKILEFLKPGVVQAEGMDDPSMYASAYASAEVRAREIDSWIDLQSTKLVGQLIEVGFDFPEIRA